MKMPKSKTKAGKTKRKHLLRNPRTSTVDRQAERNKATATRGRKNLALAKNFGFHRSEVGNGPITVEQVLRAGHDPHPADDQARIRAETHEFDQAEAAARPLLDEVTTLVEDAEDLLGATSDPVNRLTQSIRHELSSRRQLLRKLSGLALEQAKRSATVARRELQQPAAAARRALAQEKNRRDQELTATQQHQQDLISQLDRAQHYLPDTSSLPAQLGEQAEKLKQAQTAATTLARQGQPGEFDQTITHWRDLITQGQSALVNAKSAVDAERTRREATVKQVNDQLTVDPLPKLAALIQNLAVHSKDARLTPYRDGLQQAKARSEEARNRLNQNLTGTARTFNSLANDANRVLRDLADEINEAEAELQAKITFTTQRDQNKALLEWGNRQDLPFQDTRVDAFQEFWRKLGNAKAWSQVTPKLGELSQHIQNLQTAQNEVTTLENDIQAARNTIQAGTDSLEQAQQLWQDLGVDGNAVPNPYPRITNLLKSLLPQSTGDIYGLRSLGGLHLAHARQSLQEIEQRWQGVVNNIAGELAALQLERANRPFVNGAVVIRSNLKNHQVVDLLPRNSGNAAFLARDILNHPFEGTTGFTVKGRPVYHSSAGSGSQSGANAGTIFWISRDNNEASPREIVAMGRHDQQSSSTSEYIIEWSAPGVKVPDTKRVELSNLKKALADT